MVREDKYHIVLYQNAFLFNKSLWTNLILLLMEPVAVFICFGVGLNFVVGTIEGQRYSDFLLPGLIMSTTMVLAFYISGVELFQKIFEAREYRNITLAPVNSVDVLVGEVIWSILKSFAVGLILMFMLYVSGPYTFISVLLATPILLLNCLWAVGMGMVAASFFRNIKQLLVFQTVVLIPVYFICGAFYPITHFPQFVQKVLLLVPLTHSTMATHEVLKSEFSSVLVLNIVILLVASYFLILWGYLRLKKLYASSYNEK